MAMVSTPANDRTSRFEFRVFGDDLRNEFQRVAAELNANTRDATSSTETYLASRLTIDSNVKIKGEVIEVKKLERRSGVLELWAPYFSGRFPISSIDFADRIAAQLGANIDLPHSQLSRADVLDLCTDEPSLALIEVTKMRERFSIDDGFAEIVDLAIAGHATQSMAFESISETVVSAAIKRLRLADPLNESYPAHLQRLAFR